MNELVIDAKEENLTTVLEFVESELIAKGCSARVQNHIALAVEEIFINITNYAYESEVGAVIIRSSIDDEVSIEFEDNGVPYNPLENPEPDTDASLEEREIGGLGIHMVKNIMDSVEYRNEDKKNILIIRKCIE